MSMVLHDLSETHSFFALLFLYIFRGVLDKGWAGHGVIRRRGSIGCGSDRSV